MSTTLTGQWPAAVCLNPVLICLWASHFSPQSDTSQQDPADMAQWLSDLFALLSKLETVNTTQQYMRDLKTELACNQVKGG